MVDLGAVRVGGSGRVLRDLRDREQETKGPHYAVLFFVVGMSLTVVPWLLGGRPVLAMVGALSPPFLVMLSLFNGAEVDAILGRGPLESIPILGIHGQYGDRAFCLVAAAVLGCFVLLFLARWLDRKIDLEFDSAVGRTDCAEEPSRAG